jgi:hypothetical protein
MSLSVYKRTSGLNIKILMSVLVDKRTSGLNIKILMSVLVGKRTSGSKSTIYLGNVPFLTDGISSWMYIVVVFDPSNIQYHKKSISNKIY